MHVSFNSTVCKSGYSFSLVVITWDRLLLGQLFWHRCFKTLALKRPLWDSYSGMMFWDGCSRTVTLEWSLWNGCSGMVIFQSNHLRAIIWSTVSEQFFFFEEPLQNNWLRSTISVQDVVNGSARSASITLILHFFFFASSITSNDKLQAMASLPRSFYNLKGLL